MAIPVEERLDLRVPRKLKEEVARRARGSGQSLNECVTALLCEAIGWDPAAHPIPRKTPGRRVGDRS